MTDNNHPITPPPELVEQWREKWQKRWKNEELRIQLGDYIATQAARWGFKQHIELDAAELEAKLQKARDEELEACCEYLAHFAYWEPEDIRKIRTARRPKPPSLKAQALKALKKIDDACESEGFSRSDDTDIIRRALEQLND